MQVHDRHREGESAGLEPARALPSERRADAQRLSVWSSPVSPRAMWSSAGHDYSYDRAPLPYRPLPELGPSGHDGPFLATAFARSDPSQFSLDDGHLPFPGPMSARADDIVTQRSVSTLRHHTEAQQAGPAGLANTSRSSRLSDSVSSHGPCADIQHRGLMVLGLDAPEPASSSRGSEGSGGERHERLGRPKSFPSLYAASLQPTIWQREEVLDSDYCRQNLTNRLYRSARAGGPPTPRGSPRPFPVPQQLAQLPPPMGYGPWDLDELPCPPPSLVGPIYRDHPPRPVHARAVSLDHSSNHAPSPRRGELPGLLTGSASLHEVPSVLQHRPSPYAPMEDVVPVFTLPASGYASSSSCSSYFAPAPRIDEGHVASHEWSHRWHGYDSPIEMPISAPVDYGRFQPYPAYRRGHSRASSVQEDATGSVDCLYTRSPTGAADAPLVTPPASPSRPRPTSVTSSASEVGTQMSPPQPRRRQSSSVPDPDAVDATDTKRKKPHKCEYPDCGRAFKRAEHLRRHERVHTQERPFQCQAFACGMRFR